MFIRVLFIISIFSCIGCGGNQKENQGLINHVGDAESDYYVSDAICGHFHKPNVNRVFDWAEHPSGKIEMNTNNIGLRSDKDTEIAKGGKKRILVTGDSHTDGVVMNDESFCARLEQSMNGEVEVLNAGVGYFGIQNYRAILEKFEEYEPDEFIIAYYTGNDFLDAVRIEVENGRMVGPVRPKNYYDNLWKVDEEAPGYTGQLINQVNFFQMFPEFENRAFEVIELE